MNKYRKKETILHELTIESKVNAKTLELKDKFNDNLRAFNLNINDLNKFNYQIASIQLICFMHNKPITTVQEAQILGCSQATIAKVHSKLSKAKMIKIISNPMNRAGHNKRQLKFLITRLWHKLSELDDLHFQHLDLLKKAIFKYSNEKKLYSVHSYDGLREIDESDFGTKIIDI